ncbi:PAS domain S-box-containing protein/diguanylate cyclase (GGDEF) domain-containing protein [Phyllobacterium sp. YR620]|uniref:EAL domain-containing protein n=1 Tax=Phyllobacterium sp. YR620 TaxID=1881066 RepID=UPI0008810E61|nr:EAL domain-containing protein [Phyllobacterium sp. YR620]SDP91210.1 PAS domain S-box-containing protein/diguanylate cyclase (GGDEF) domain-containing protein [Phyllobacterium sp. YR620]
MTDVRNMRLHTRPNQSADSAEANRWSFALESAGLGVWDSNLVTGQCYYSSTWKRMLGYREDELGDSGDLWLTLIHPDDKQRAIESGQRHIAGEIPQIETEFRLRHKDGHWVWVLDRGRVVEWDADGKPTRMIGVQTDITDQKNAEHQLALLNQRVELALDAGQIGLWHFNIETETVLWDRRMREIFGIGSGTDEVPRATWHRLLHPEDAAIAEQAVEATFKTGIPMKTSYRIVKPDGEVRHVYALARLVKREGMPEMLMGSIWDITEQVHSAEALAREKDLYRVTLQSIGDAVLTTNVDDIITFANPAAERLLLRSASELIGAPVSGALHLVDEVSDHVLTSSTMRAMENRSTVDRVENAVVVRSDGERRSIRDLASPIFNTAGAVTGSVLVVQDVTNARNLQRELSHAATHDTLTGLLNRRAFEVATASILASPDRRHALLYIDLDRFKMVNDTLGHAAGDALLKLATASMNSVLPHDAVIGRLGGDEFAAVLPSANPEDTKAIAERLIEEIRKVRLEWDGKLQEIGASVGIAFLDDPNLTLNEAVARADAACYAAKAEGRNRTAIYDENTGAAKENLASVQAASGILEALAEGRLEIYGQEIREISDTTENTVYIEILSRMRAPDGTLIAPAEFIPAAERFGLMGIVDRWIIEHTLELYGERLMATDKVAIALNLSANTISDPTLWSFIKTTTERTNVSPSRLIFEITETTAVNNYEAAENFVKEARAAGCRISLDDFGAGLSSFGYLHHFDVDSIKIDGAFIEKLSNSRLNQAVVRSIGSVARELGVDVVAEHIEDTGAVGILRSLGIGFGQGFLFHRPQPLGNLLQDLDVREANS